jgi:hypothetical protein
MSDATAATLKPTPLHARHLASGARMVPYAGWDMPVEYSGITAEHLAVRTRAGLFDVSHMGEIEIAGKDAVATVQHLTCNDASRLKQGQAQYSGLLTAAPTSTTSSSIAQPNHFMLVVNAANAAKAYSRIVEQAKTVGRRDCRFDARYALLAVGAGARHGSRSRRSSGRCPCAFTYGEGAGAGADRARATRANGFEIYVPPNMPIASGRRCPKGSAAGVVPRVRRARHAAARSGDAALRQRHRRPRDAARSWAGMSVGWNPRRGAPASRGRGAHAGRSRQGPRHCPPRTRCSRTAPRLVWSERHAHPVSGEGGSDGLRAAVAGNCV